MLAVLGHAHVHQHDRVERVAEGAEGQDGDVVIAEFVFAQLPFGQHKQVFAVAMIPESIEMLLQVGRDDAKLNHLRRAFFVAGLFWADGVHGIAGHAFANGADETNPLFNNHFLGYAIEVGAVQNPPVKIAENQGVGDVAFQVPVTDEPEARTKILRR